MKPAPETPPICEKCKKPIEDSRQIFCDYCAENLDNQTPPSLPPLKAYADLIQIVPHTGPSAVTKVSVTARDRAIVERLKQIQGFYLGSNDDLEDVRQLDKMLSDLIADIEGPR